MQNDILCSLDNRKPVFILLLDDLRSVSGFRYCGPCYSVIQAFRSFWYQRHALARFESYLELRKYYVHVEGGKSSVRSLTCGMPQGSVLGPFLYVVYTAPVPNIIKAHKVDYHFYADDTQLYVAFKCDSVEDAYLVRTRVERCVEDIDSWMIKNKLRLNDDKTELVVISSKHQPRPAITSIQVGDD